MVESLSELHKQFDGIIVIIIDIAKLIDSEEDKTPKDVQHIDADTVLKEPEENIEAALFNQRM
jgi:hypothetical protein